MKSVMAMAGFLCVTALAHATPIYNCDGTYQQHPCVGGTEVTVRPASGHAAAAAPDDAQEPAASRVDRINATSDALALQRQRLHYERRVVPDARAAIAYNRDTCAAQEQRLRDEQHAYVQNLWGKTHSAEMAAEIAALQVRCDGIHRDLTAQYEQAVRSCHELGGCASVP